MLGKKKLKGKVEKVLLKKVEDTLFSIFMSQRAIPNIYYIKNSSICKKISERLGIKLERAKIIGAEFIKDMQNAKNA